MRCVGNCLNKISVSIPGDIIEHLDHNVPGAVKLLHFVTIEIPKIAPIETCEINGYQFYVNNGVLVTKVLS